MKMCCVELRYCVILVFNILKSFMVNERWGLDVLGVTMSWSKFILFSIIILFLSFCSIKIELTTSSTPRIHRQLHDFSPFVFSWLLLSIILPQCAAWIYFLLLWLSAYQIFSDVIKGSLRAILRGIPGSSITAQPDSETDRADQSQELNGIHFGEQDLESGRGDQSLELNDVRFGEQDLETME